MGSQGNPAHGLSGSEVWPPHLAATGSPQKPPSKLLTSPRQEETIRWRGREAGAGLEAEGGWGRGRCGWSAACRWEGR